MSEITSIRPADLRAIENNLDAIYKRLSTLDKDVDTVNENVKVVYDEIGGLAKDFYTFVDRYNRDHRLSIAETRLVKIRQELDKKYGHYDVVRRTTTGILQADDLGIIKKTTISNVTEELMMQAPGYWLAPCLVALAAWINDQQELAEKAVREAIKRDDEKTSLFFALVCRRADRKNASLKWTQRYLANQNEECLDRKTIIILDAFASGLLGADSEGLISKQMTQWLDNLSDKVGFVEQQTKQWSEAINLKRKPLSSDQYTYLRKYSKTWPQLQNVLEGAYLHAEILSYFTNIFEKESSNVVLKEQLDEILDSLVTDYDDEELPLRKEERLEQLIIDFEGDEKRANANMSIEVSAFETEKDFTQLLTDAAMNPETSHASVSTQKFAIALSKDWISEAYNDIIAQNRMKVPHEIQINVDTFNDKTTDGQNEDELIYRFKELVESERQAALSRIRLTTFDEFSLYGGAGISVLGLIMCITGEALLGMIAIIAGIALMFNYSSKKKNNETKRTNVENEYDAKLENGSKIIRATLAEIVDFRSEFDEKDAESQKVLDFLEQITPDQYVKRLADSNRRIKV